MLGTFVNGFGLCFRGRGGEGGRKWKVLREWNTEREGKRDFEKGRGHEGEW